MFLFFPDLWFLKINLDQVVYCLLMFCFNICFFLFRFCHPILIVRLLQTLNWFESYVLINHVNFCYLIFKSIIICMVKSLDNNLFHFSMCACIVFSFISVCNKYLFMYIFSDELNLFLVAFVDKIKGKMCYMVSNYIWFIELG